MTNNRKISNLIHTEDWLSVWIGAIIIIIGAVAVLTGWFDFSVLSFKTWTAGEVLSEADAAKTVPLMASSVHGASGRNASAPYSSSESFSV